MESTGSRRRRRRRQAMCAVAASLAIAAAANGGPLDRRPLARPLFAHANRSIGLLSFARQAALFAARLFVPIDAADDKP